MEFFDNLISDSLGGSSFFTAPKKLYKFEKIKQLTYETIQKNPNIKLIDMGVGEPDKKADELICDVLNTECRKEEKKLIINQAIIVKIIRKTIIVKIISKIINLKILTIQNLVVIMR